MPVAILSINSVCSSICVCLSCSSKQIVTVVCVVVFQDTVLWACLATMAAYAKDLNTAETAYAAIDEVCTKLSDAF